MIRILLTTCLAASLVSFSYSQSRINLKAQWSYGSFGDDLGKGAMVTRDIDKNGRPEIITTGTTGGLGYYPSGIFSILEFDPLSNIYTTKWISRAYFNEILSLEVMDINDDGIDEIYLGLNGGEIKVINSSTYKEIKSFYAGKSTGVYPFDRHGVTSMTRGDIDNNGTDNFVATAGDTTYIYSTALSLLKKITIYKGGTVTLANVDQDNLIEAIYSGGHVMEFNSNGTAKKEFRFFPSAYGTARIRIADMNKDGIKDVLYSSRDTVHMCNIAMKQRFRSIKMSGDYRNVNDFQLYDYTKDGTPDVFMGNDQFDVLFVHNGLTSNLEFRLDDPKRNGLTALQITDLDQIPGPELLWTSGANCSCSDHFFVYDMNTKELKWQSKFLESSFAAFDFGNVDDEPDDELLVGSTAYYQDYRDYPYLSQFDLQTKNPERESLLSQNAFVDNITAIKIGDVDNDGKNEILAGIYYGYAFTYVYVLDKDHNYLRNFEISGMDHVIDIEVTDIDNDNENEVIVTSGTYVSGSTNPEEWQNYIYVFDGKTGVVEWRSEKLGGMSSQIGNIVVANVDNDPALEILALQYTSWRENTSKLYIIDGWTHEVKNYVDRTVGAFDVEDFDQDGTQDIVAGTEAGAIVIIDGASLQIKKEIASGFGEINAMNTIDQNGDHVSEYVFSTNYQLMIFDPLVGNVVAKSDTLNGSIGIYGSMRISGSTKENRQVFINANHALYSFVIEDAINVIPTDFALLSPVNAAALPLASEWIEFSWQSSTNTDNDPIHYQIHVTGPDVDSNVSQIDQTHILFDATLFEADKTYTWYVTATDGFDNAVSQSFTFKRTELVITSAHESFEKNISIYPNPFNQNFTVHNSSGHTLNQLIITDVYGSERITANVQIKPGDEQNIELVESFADGMYICRFISNGATVYTTKITKH